MLAKLRILHGRFQDSQGQSKRPEVKIRGPRFVIGSAADCSMRCRCSTVSSYHCEVRIEQQRVVVRTLSREKGTFVNDSPVERERVLQAGDHLRIGRLEFEVVIEPSSTAPCGARVPDHDSQSDVVAEQISDFLAEADERERLRRARQPELRQLHLESAAADTANTQSLAVETQGSADSARGAAKAKAEPGKLPEHLAAKLLPKIVAKDSTDAAEQALRKLFSR